MQITITIDPSSIEQITALNSLLLTVGGLPSDTPIVPINKSADEVAKQKEKPKPTADKPKSKRAAKPSGGSEEEEKPTTRKKAVVSDVSGEEADSDEVTLIMLQNRVSKMLKADKSKKPDIVEKLSEFDAKGISKLDEEHYEAFNEFLNGLED